VEPTKWVELDFQTGGLVTEVAVTPGDKVQADQLLVQLDVTDLKLSVRRAEVELALAEAQLALQKAEPRPEEIAIAQENIRMAEAALSAAVANRDQLKAGATEAETATAQAQVAQADANRKEVQFDYDRTLDDGPLGNHEEKLRVRLYAAEMTLEAARTRLEELQAGATDEQLRASRAAVLEAIAQRDQAQAQLDLLLAGPTEETITAMETSVAQAKIALAQAQATLEKATLLAPFAGQVVAVEARPGEVVSSGQVGVVLADLNTLCVQVTDLSQFDIVKIEPGQEVRVSLDALPGKDLSGKVICVSPRGIGTGDDVIYTAKIDLVDQDPDLRWGMTVIVEIVTAP
jgi:multidrug resistance efflux pump